MKPCIRQAPLRERPQSKDMRFLDLIGLCLVIGNDKIWDKDIWWYWVGTGPKVCRATPNDLSLYRPLRWLSQVRSGRLTRFTGIAGRRRLATLYYCCWPRRLSPSLSSSAGLLPFRYPLSARTRSLDDPVGNGFDYRYVGDCRIPAVVSRQRLHAHFYADHLLGAGIAGDFRRRLFRQAAALATEKPAGF